MRDVHNPSRERRVDLRLDVAPSRSAVRGVRRAQVEETLRHGITGIVAGQYRAVGEEEPWSIRVALEQPRDATHFRARLDLLQSLYVENTRREAVPFSALGALRMQQAPRSIQHRDRATAITVAADVQDGFNADRLAHAVVARVGKLSLPPGVRVVPAGELETRVESIGELRGALIATAGGIVLVLLVAFRTFRCVLVVLSVVPLGVIGGLFGLFIAGYSLSFTAAVGFLALIGIEIKNSILLVDFANQLREEGVALDAAIQRAGEVRFTPVLLTSLTAIGGLVPLVLENSSLYSPLAVVILGGLVSSTVLSRIVTPVIYRTLAPHVLGPHADAPARAAVPRSEPAFPQTPLAAAEEKTPS